MRPLRKDEIENNEHNLYSVVPPQVADHPLFNQGHTVGIMTAESPRFATAPGGNEALSADLKGFGLQHEPTHGSYGAKENSFIVHNPTREHMYMLGRKYGQEAVVYSQDGKHELLYTNGPNAGKHQVSKPEMHYSQTQPKDFYTHLPGKGYVTLHFGDELHDSPVKGTVPLEHHTPQQPLNPMERDLVRKFAIDLAAVLGSVLEKAEGDVPRNLKVACPNCKAKVGESCTGIRSPIKGIKLVHSERLKAAADEANKADK